jgi:hypothetical protein
MLLKLSLGFKNYQFEVKYQVLVEILKEDTSHKLWDIFRNILGTIRCAFITRGLYIFTPF